MSVPELKLHLKGKIQQFNKKVGKRSQGTTYFFSYAKLLQLHNIRGFEVQALGFEDQNLIKEK